MEFIWQGIALGATVSILVGPLLFVLLQAAIKHGKGAGIRVAIGIWISDFLFIALLYGFYRKVNQWTSESSFEVYAGIAGSILLCTFGVAMIYSAYRPRPRKEASKAFLSAAFLLRGFLVNSVNPFTVFFWLGIITTVMISKQAAAADYLRFTLALMSVIIITDLLKVFFADKIGQKLKPRIIQKISLVSGSALIIFGCYLFIQSII